MDNIVMANAATALSHDADAAFVAGAEELAGRIAEDDKHQEGLAKRRERYRARKTNGPARS